MAKIQRPYNHIINRTGDTGAILEKVSTELFRPVAAGYHYRYDKRMNMEKLEEHFYLNSKSREIWSRTIWCRRYVKDLDHAEVESVILNDNPEIFINAEADKLSRIPDENVLAFWKSDLKDHVVETEGDFDRRDFENGYCFVVELWEAKGGKKVLVLRYHH